MVEGGLLVTVRLTPRGGRDAFERVDRLADGRPVLKARVRAAREDGAANEALVKLLAETLDVAPSTVSLVSGAVQRIKILEVWGDGPALAEILDERFGGDPI